MGRWAQNRRSGGGPQTVNLMTAAFISDSTSIDIEWSLPVTAGLLTPANFVSLPSGRTGVSFNALPPNSLNVVFSGTILTDTEVRYNGGNPGFLAPQTIPLS